MNWILCKNEMPPELIPVNITWVNRKPKFYYQNIKDVPFTATGIYYKEKWYWYSNTCEDILREYGFSEFDKVDGDIEIVAWMPLPMPYKGETE